MDYYKKYLKYKSKYNLAKENMRGGVIDVLDYYKKTVGLVTYTLSSEQYGTITTKIQSYSHNIINDNPPIIARFDEAFRYLGSDGYGLGVYISIVKSWIDTGYIDLVFALALESTLIEVTPYLLNNRFTIYPMCLRFVCRLVLNNYKEKEDLYCLLKSLNERTVRYLEYYKIDITSIGSCDKPIFTPTCLLNGPLSLRDAGMRNESYNTYIAWFGIMDPNEIGGLMNTKKIIKDFIETLSNKQHVLILLNGLLNPTETGIIRTDFNGSGSEPGSEPGITLTIYSIAQLLNS